IKVTAQIKEQPSNYVTSRIPAQPGDENEPNPSSEPNQPNQAGGALASIHVGDLTPELARQLDLPNGVRGVVVTNVDPDSGVAELQKGDVIEEINQQAINSVTDYEKISGSLDPNQAQVLSVCRHRARSFIVL